MNNLTEFIEYVWSFYAPHSDLYPIKGLIKQDIYDAFVVYRKRIQSAESNNGRWLKCLSVLT